MINNVQRYYFSTKYQSSAVLKFYKKTTKNKESDTSATFSNHL